MKYNFKWDRWVDPLTPGDFRGHQDMDDIDDDDDDEDDEGLEVTHHNYFQALPTPFGMFTITNHALASSHFDFWKSFDGNFFEFFFSILVIFSRQI